MEANQPGRHPLRHTWGIFTAIALLVVLLFDVKASAAAPERQPPIRPAAAPWQRIPLPATDGRAFHTIAVSPSDPDTVYACAGPWLGSADPPPIGPIWLFRTRDAGAHWELLSAPPLAGSRCSVYVSAAEPEQIALDVVTGSHYYAGQGLCAETTSYQSGDGVQTWRTLPGVALASAEAANAYCGFWMAGHTRFVEIIFGPHGPPTPTTVRTAIERSDDGDTNWQRADRGLPADGAIWEFTQGGPYASVRSGDETMVATVVSYMRTLTGLADTLQLWGTSDGRTWRLLNDLHPFPANQPASLGKTQPHYVAVRDQLPAFDFYTTAQELNANNQTMGILPPLPVPNAASDRTGILQVLGALPDGRLLVLGVSPDRGLWPVPSPAASRMNSDDYLRTSWLWLWDPAAARWAVVLAPLAAEPGRIPYGCGNCWEVQLTRRQGLGAVNGHDRSPVGTHVWLRDSFGGESAAYRLFVPDP
jgi:hypothetical protein